MPATSKAQQKFMGIVHGIQKGTIKPSDVSGAAKKVAKTMKKKSAKDFAKTKHKGLPNKVRSENMNEDGHTDVASIERKLKLIIQDSVDTIKKLRSMSNEDSLPSWWTDKITLAKDYVSKSRDYIMNPAESVNEATSLGADMLLGGIATVIKKAGMRPKTAKMMGGGFKVSKRDKVGFKIDVEIRGLDKKKTFPLQFETERGMLYVVIKNKPIKLGKYTMVTQAAQNLKKVGAALIGDKDVKRIA